MPRVPTPKTDAELDALLADIEAILLREVPRQVAELKLTEPLYGLFVCYIDLSTDEYTPCLKTCPESFLRRTIADRDVWKVWAIAEVPGILTFLTNSDGLKGKCNSAYKYLTRDEDDERDELVQILPFRRMIYRVCLALNALDWSGIVPTCAEFTVTACDWSYGHDMPADAVGSVPAAQQEHLKARGLFFNHVVPG